MEQKSFRTRFLETEYPCHYIREKDTALDVLEQLMKKDELFGIDTETYALPKYRYDKYAALNPYYSDIRLLQVFDGKQSIVFDLPLIGANEIFFDFLKSKRFLAHNALFDLQYFTRLGVPDIDIGCTLILSRLILHATYATDEGIGAGLDDMIKMVFGVELSKTVQASNWGITELTFEQIEYAAVDAIAVIRLAEKLSVGMRKMGLEKIYKISKHAQYAICSMQLNGMGFDQAYHKSLMPGWRDRLYAAKKKVIEITGLNELTAHTLAKWLEDNLEPDILAIWPRTEHDKLKTDAHAFSDFSFLEIVKPFSEYQKLDKLTSAFGNKLIESVNLDTHRVHCRYNIAGARTGRLSCSNPNLQQIPSRDSSIKKGFIAPLGRKLIVADYGQIELRVAAELSKDKQMLRAYREGIDLHRLTAAKVSGKTLDAVTENDRFFAKSLNFGLLFGLGAKKFVHYAKKSYGVDKTPEEASEAISIFRETYSGYREWQLAQANNSAGSMSVRTPSGKFRRLNSENCYGASMNTPIQGGAAEVMLYALGRIHNLLKDKSQYKLVNVVHDEIIIEAPDDKAEAVKENLEHQMTEAYLDVFPNGITNKLVETGIGQNWADAKH